MHQKNYRDKEMKSPTINFPDLYINSEDKIVDPALYSDGAFSIADNIKGASNSQIRKFYDQLIHYQNQLSTKTAEWQHIHPLINMLISKATYASARKSVTRPFADFIKNYISKINDEKDLKNFINLFEAVIGFHKEIGKK